MYLSLAREEANVPNAFIDQADSKGGWFLGRPTL